VIAWGSSRISGARITAHCWRVSVGSRVADESPATVACSVCGGSGEVWSEGSWSPDRCFVCAGAGVVDVAIDHVVENNIVEFPRTDDRRPAA